MYGCHVHHVQITGLYEHMLFVDTLNRGHDCYGINASLAPYIIPYGPGNLTPPKSLRHFYPICSHRVVKMITTRFFISS